MGHSSAGIHFLWGPLLNKVIYSLVVYEVKRVCEYLEMAFQEKSHSQLLYFERICVSDMTMTASNSVGIFFF